MVQDTGWGEAGAPEWVSPAFNYFLSRAAVTESPLGMEVKGERGTESQNRGQRTCACRNCLKQSGTYRYFGSLMLSTQERGQPCSLPSTSETSPGWGGGLSSS